MLADLAEYLVLARSGLRVETSTGPLWSTDEISLRVVARVGGQPQAGPVTSYDGSFTTSAFVALETR